MKELIVPEKALENSRAFREWFYNIHSKLFDRPVPDRDKIENILATANSVFYNNPEIPNYKSKNRKVNSSLGDLFAVAIHTVMNRYDIGCSELGRIIGLHHATIIYYRNRHEDFFRLNKKYQENYLKTIKILEYERIIPATKATQSESKRILLNLLSSKSM
jgi:hypothetical protein